MVVPDHLGCGLSDKPTRYPYNLQTHTANLVRLVEQLDLWNVTLLAHDWGGAIGLGTVTQLPDRFGRLILFNTGAFPPPRVPRRIAACRLPLLGRLAVQGANAFALAALTMASERPSELTSAFRDGIVAPYDSWSNRTAIYQFVRDIPLTTRHPTFDRLAKLEHQLRHLPTRPVQLIWGMRDWCFTPTCLERFIDIFPLAQVHRIEDAGHWVIEDARDQVIQMVDRFLDETRSAGG